MKTVEKKAEELKSAIGTAELERMNYRLSDAIREGCSVTNKAETWLGEDESMCAMSAGIVAARARGFI